MHITSARVAASSLDRLAWGLKSNAAVVACQHHNVLTTVHTVFCRRNCSGRRSGTRPARSCCRHQQKVFLVPQRVQQQRDSNLRTTQIWQYLQVAWQHSSRRLSASAVS